MSKKIVSFSIILMFSLAIIISGCTSGEEDKVLPEIPDEAIGMAKDQIKGDSVGDTSIDIDKEKKEIVLAVIVSHSANEIFAKDVGERFARLLSSFTSALNKDIDLKGPTNESLGEIYDYYDLHIIVGTGPNNVIVHGAKAKGSRVLVW